MSQLPIWMQYLTAISTPIIALMVAAIAFAQWRTAHQRMILDLSCWATAAKMWTCSRAGYRVSLQRMRAFVHHICAATLLLFTALS